MKSVLIVEDEARIREFIEVNLSARGYRVETAATAEQALELIRQTLPDVLLLDMRLPGISGLALLDILRDESWTTRIAVIAMSASTAHLEAVNDHHPEVRQTLEKPVGVGQLLEAVSQAIG